MNVQRESTTGPQPYHVKEKKMLACVHPLLSDLALALAPHKYHQKMDSCPDLTDVRYFLYLFLQGFSLLDIYLAWCIDLEDYSSLSHDHA